jgi:hypothetical protein
MRSVRNLAIAWLAVVLMAGCQMFQPQTPEEALGGAYVTITAIADTTAQRVQTGNITAEQAAAVSAWLKQAKAGADAATAALAAGEMAQGQELLAAAIAILTALEQELQP